MSPTDLTDAIPASAARPEGCHTGWPAARQPQMPPVRHRPH